MRVASLGCLLSLVLTASATAKSDNGHFSAGFSVEGSNGYGVSVTGWPHAVRVLVTEGRSEIGNVVEAEYFAPATVSRSRIEADLGSFGSVSMRFQPSGKRRRKTNPKHCQPHKVIRRLGSFTGSFHFVGEDGYTMAETSEATGSVGTPDDFLFCGYFANGKHHRHRPPPLPYIAAATANARRFATAHQGLAFYASIVGGPQRHASFTAELKEELGRISVLRFAEKPAPASSFSVTPHLHSATVTPPPPFTGIASFQREPTGFSPSWSGSLAVSFPGKPEVPLTGPNFKSVELGQSRFP